MRKTRYLALAAMSLAVLSGCGQHYRYPCQDPENWDKDYCQKPLCEVNRDCPEYIFKEADSAKLPLPSAPAIKPTTGVCK